MYELIFNQKSSELNSSKALFCKLIQAGVVLSFSKLLVSDVPEEVSEMVKISGETQKQNKITHLEKCQILFPTICLCVFHFTIRIQE